MKPVVSGARAAGLRHRLTTGGKAESHMTALKMLIPTRLLRYLWRRFR